MCEIGWETNWLIFFKDIITQTKTINWTTARKFGNNTRNLSSTTWGKEKDFSAKGKQLTLLGGGIRTEGSEHWIKVLLLHSALNKDAFIWVALIRPLDIHGHLGVKFLGLFLRGKCLSNRVPIGHKNNLVAQSASLASRTLDQSLLWRPYIKLEISLSVKVLKEDLPFSFTAISVLGTDSDR